MRILILLAIGLLLYLIFRNLFRKARIEQQSHSKETSMVRCQHCGLHLLPEEAIRSEQQYFCCQEHLEAFQK